MNKGFIETGIVLGITALLSLSVLGVMWYFGNSDPYGAPTNRIERTILPEADNAYDLGSTSKAWNDFYADGVIQLGGLTGSSDCLIVNSSGVVATSTCGGGIDTLGAIGSSPNANAATITGTTLNLQPADGSFGGVVTTVAQTFTGGKTFANIFVPTGAIFGSTVNTPGITQEFRFGSAFGTSVSTYVIKGVSIQLNNAIGGKSTSLVFPDYSYAPFLIASRVVTEYTSGNHPLISQMVIKPFIPVAGDATVSDTASLYIEGAATSTVVSGENYSLWVDNIGGGGKNRIDGETYFMDGNIGIATTSPAYTLDTFGSFRAGNATADGSVVISSAGVISIGDTSTIYWSAAGDDIVIDNISDVAGASVELYSANVAEDSWADFLLNSGNATNLKWVGASIDARYSFYEPTWSYVATLNAEDITVDRLFTFPDLSGTLALGTATSNYLTYWSSANVLTGIASGTVGHVLTATSTAPGFSWEAASGGGITSLNGLTGATQTFATSTSESVFNISSSGTAHTFSIGTNLSTLNALATTTNISPLVGVRAAISSKSSSHA